VGGNQSTRRKPEHPEKTHDFRQSVDGLFSPESVARWNPRSEVKDACSDDCATEVPYNSEDAHLNILNKETSQDHDLKITKVSISIILRLFIICV
jgi:hypothetical protein